MSYQHRQDARIDEVQIHNMIGDGWEWIYIHGKTDIIHYVYDEKHCIEFVVTDLAQCRAPYKGDTGSTAVIGNRKKSSTKVLFPFLLSSHLNSNQIYKTNNNNTQNINNPNP